MQLTLSSVAIIESRVVLIKNKMQNAPGVTKRAKMSALADIDPICVCVCVCVYPFWLRNYTRPVTLSFVHTWDAYRSRRGDASNASAMTQGILKVAVPSGINRSHANRACPCDIAISPI